MISKRITLFSVGFLVRSVIGIVVYGGIDVRSYFDLTRATLHFSLPALDSFFNYFPLGAFFWWFCGWLQVKTALPLPYCVKCVPIFFDALLGVLIYEFLLHRKKTYAYQVGLLYALNPVTIIVDCIHGQWESVFLFFLLLSFYIRDFYANSVKKYIWIGFLFTISFLLKPVSLIFVPLIFERMPGFFSAFGRTKKIMMVLIGGLSVYVMAGLGIAFFMIKKYKITLPIIFSHSFFLFFMLALLACATVILMIFFKKIWPQLSYEIKHFLGYQCVMATCGVITTLIAMSAFTFWLGFDLKQVFDTMLRFFNQGTQIIGLPMGHFFKEVPWIGVVLKNRLWTLGFFGFAVFGYYRGLIHPFTAMLFVYSCVFGFTAVSPHYLVWIIPFVFLEGFYWWGALYSFLVFIMSIFYYAHPFSSPFGPYHNIMSFALLKRLSWLAAPDFLTRPACLKIIYVLGNYVIPFLCIILFLYVMKQLIQGKTGAVDKNKTIKKPIFGFFANYFLVVNVCVCLCIIILMLVNDSNLLYHQFDVTMSIKMQAYDIAYGGGLPARAVYGVFHFFNIVSLFFLFGLMWFLYACYVARNIKKVD